MTTCYTCHNAVDEAVLMACHHHICLQCGYSRMEADRGVRCACGIHTQLTDGAYQTLVAKGRQDRSMSQLDAGRRTGHTEGRPRSPREQEAATIHVRHNHPPHSGSGYQPHAHGRQGAYESPRPAGQDMSTIHVRHNHPMSSGSGYQAGTHGRQAAYESPSPAGQDMSTVHVRHNHPMPAASGSQSDVRRTSPRTRYQEEPRRHDVQDDEYTEYTFKSRGPASNDTQDNFSERWRATAQPTGKFSEAWRATERTDKFSEPWRATAQHSKSRGRPTEDHADDKSKSLGRPTARTEGTFSKLRGRPTSHESDDENKLSTKNSRFDRATTLGGTVPSERYCPVHPEETKKFWCVDCGLFICAECGMVGDHNGHTFRTLRQQAGAVQQELHESIATLNAYSRDAGREFEKVDSQRRNIEMVLAKSKKTLERQVQHIIRDLEVYQENMEKAYTEAADDCFNVLTRARDEAMKSEENFRLHADDISEAVASDEADLVEWYGKSKETIDKLVRAPPKFQDFWPYLVSTPAELALSWDGSPMISATIPKLEAEDVPEPSEHRLPSPSYRKSGSRFHAA